MMTNNDIIRFALMPRFNQIAADDAIASEAIQPISYHCIEINNLLNKATTLTTAYNKLLKHGLTDFIINEYSELLAPYSINFQTQSISACIEGLSGIIEQIWVSIKNALIKLLDYVLNDPMFTMWFNKCEFYRVRIANIISTTLRSYTKVNLDTFNAIVVIGWKLQDFQKRVFHTGNLITKIKNLCNTKYEQLDIYQQFNQEIEGLNCLLEDDTVTYVTPKMEKGTTYDFLWKPYDVYQVANNLYSRVATNSMYLTRTNQELIRVLKLSIAEADNILSGKEDGSDQLKIELSKKRIKNIRNMITLVHIAIENLCCLCAQWYRMASSFDTDERAIANKNSLKNNKRAVGK